MYVNRVDKFLVPLSIYPIKGCGSKSVYFQRIASIWRYTDLFPHPLTLASDDHNVNDNCEKLVPTALPCNDCSDECGGYTVENVPAEIPDNEDEVVDEDDEDQESHHCNCNGRMGPCPLDGDCRKEKSCIYSCKVTRLDTGVWNIHWIDCKDFQRKVLWSQCQHQQQRSNWYLIVSIHLGFER